VRILVLAINYWPEQTGIAPFTTGRCESLAAHGHQVTICTAMPYYPEWRVASSYRHRLWLREQHNGVTILRSHIYVPSRIDSPRRILHEASFVAATLMRALLQRKPDLMLVVSPPLGLALPAVMLSRLWRVPYVFHVPDLQPDAAIELGMLSFGALTRVLRALERFAYRHAALVSTLTDVMRGRIVSKGIAPNKVKLFSDWAPPELFDIPLEGGGRSFRDRHGLCGKFLVLHCGNMGVKQGLEVVLNAAEFTRDDTEVVYLLVGDGATRSALEARATSAALRNVRFLALQPHAEFMELLACADVCLITQRREVANIVFPSKTLTIMAAGRPVIASVNHGSEVARVVNEAQAGIVVEAENPGALLAAIENIRNQAEGRTAMSRRAREYARLRWNRDRILAETEAELAAVLKPEESIRHLRSARALPTQPVGGEK
jgi:colanic acid biosynthesis glycosyl transferase WcaI